MFFMHVESFLILTESFILTTLSQESCQRSNWGNQRKTKLWHRGKEVLIDKVFDYENIKKTKDAIVLILDSLIF